MRKGLTRFENVEFVIPANNTAGRINFPDIPQLRNDTTQEIAVCAIQVQASDECPNSWNGNPLLPPADLGKIFLTLYINQEESVFRLNLNRLRNTYVAAGSGQVANEFWQADLQEFNYRQVDWVKSYITIQGALTSNAQQCILFGVDYLKLVPGTFAKWYKMQDNAMNAGILTSL